MHSRLLLPLLLSASAQAQTPDVLPPVSTELRRDASVMPYAQTNELLAKLARFGEGLVRLDYQVDRDKTKLPLSSLRMAVLSEEAYLPIKMDAEGRFHLPLLPPEQAKTADFASNAPKGQLWIKGTLELTVTPEHLDMATVRRVMRVAHRLKQELLPWYLRALFPRIVGVVACAPSGPLELEWREGGQLLGLPLPSGERDPRARPTEPLRVCTLLTGQERWPDEARLVAPAGATLSVKLGD